MFFMVFDKGRVIFMSFFCFFGVFKIIVGVIFKFVVIFNFAVSVRIAVNVRVVVSVCVFVRVVFKVF